MNKTKIQIIKTNIKAQLDNKEIAPLFIAGVPGTGKSKTIYLLSQELNMNFLDISAPTLSTEVLNG